jgi:hypothetical protein
MPLSIANVLGGVTSTVVAGSTTATPAANTLICDSGPLPAGDGESCSYMVSVISGQQGTPDTNYTNVLINVGGSGSPVTGGVTYGPLTSFPATASGGTTQRFRVNITNGQHVLLCVGNTAGGAGAIYSAGMTITRLKDKYDSV